MKTWRELIREAAPYAALIASSAWIVWWVFNFPA